MNNIDTIIDNLIEKHPHLTPTDIADTIWLAIKLLPDKDSYPQNNNKVEPSETLPSHNLEPVNQVSPTVITQVQNTKITPSDLKPNLIIPSPRVETEIETPVASLHSTNTQSKEDYQPNLSQDRQSSYVNIAKSRVLPYLATSRALRPLIKKIPSKTQFLIDEQATAQKMADDLIFIKELPLDLVLKPATKPSYQLTLIVDQSESMIIWKEIIDEFESLLKHLGAFSNVQTWQLISDGENVQISKKNSSSKEVPRNYKELVSTKDNHLIFIISDCVASNWHNGKIAEALNFLGKTSTIVIFQVFPKTLWTHTALDEALMVRLDTIANSPNSNINSQPLYYVEEKMLGDYYKSPIPVLIFDPISISYWAKSLVGIPNHWVSGARFPLNIKNLQNPHDNSFVNASPNQLETVQEDLFEVDPDEIVENFYQNASPTARKLAVILSLLTFDFNLISIIKREFLPELQQFHIAEIFLSGLIKKVRKLSKDKEKFYYDFIEGTQELLVSGTSNPDQDYIALVKSISAYVKETIDNPSSFSAILQPLIENKDKILSALSKPFAYLDSKTLKSLSDTCNLYNETNSSSRNIKSNYTISFDGSTDSLPNGVNSKYVITLRRNNILLPITNFVWAKTNSLLAIVGVGGYISVVNTINKKEEWAKILESEVSTISWSPDDKQLALGTVKGSIYLLDAKTGEELKTLSENQSKIYNIEWITRDKTNYDLVSCSADQTIKKWDTQNYEHKHTGKWPITNLEAIAWTPNWDTLATISNNNQLKVWHLNADSWHGRYKYNLYEKATALCWKTDKKYLIFGLLNGDIAFTPWPKKEENRHEAIFFRRHKERITSLAISTDNKILASKSLDNTLKLWSVDNQEVLLEIFSQTIKQSLFSALAFHTQEPILTTLNDSDGTLYLWELDVEKLIENQKVTKLPEYKSLYTTIAQEIRLKDMDNVEELSAKMSKLKELEEKVSKLLSPTEFAEWKKENNRFVSLLQRNYQDWNLWKFINQEEVIDLSYQDLSKYKLHLNFIDFDNVNLRGSDLREIDLTNASINNADLSEAILIDTKLGSATLVNSKLVKAHLAGNDVLYSDFSGADLSEADLTGVSLIEVNLSNVNFTKAKLIKAKLENTPLSMANFDEAYLADTELWDVDLTTAKNLQTIKHETFSMLAFTHKDIAINKLPTSFLKNCCVVKYDKFEYKTVKVDKKGKITERYKKQANQIIDDLGNGVLLEMVEIPSGSFMMGSPTGEGYDREKPQRKVTVPTFYIGKYQVTQEQWEAVMGVNPSYFKGNGKLPVERVNWEEAVEFCKKLSEKTNKIYRLPSEAEWEYACRAGTETAFAFGETINTDIVNYYGPSPYGRGVEGKYRAKTTVVGSLGVANDFGLYDMHGNVWEWCQDKWHSNYESEWHSDYEGVPIDESEWEKQGDNHTRRVVRGGSWNLSAGNCRSAYRDYYSSDNRYDDIGFRVIMATRTLK